MSREEKSELAWVLVPCITLLGCVAWLAQYVK